MARDNITVQNYTYDNTDRIGIVNITKQTVTQANGIKIEKALSVKDNSLVITVENTATSAMTCTVKAGEKQNAILGGGTVALPASSVTQFVINRDPNSFENNDGSVDIDFATGFTGNIYCVGEKAGLGS